ncbi:hypothetical protein FN846DRAFT_944358 [Sphaerosporella brunnea]|uniref:Uncharacterized protein n=1 Tax=Sphaerosporella brunnea TaxID=1250544 RepID=A0A5J5F044_9PEZI|nr:hypothetical protein FN846DRAFT_944358 [Sphaerosporella brunnea]
MTAAVHTAGSTHITAASRRPSSSIHTCHSSTAGQPGFEPTQAPEEGTIAHLKPPGSSNARKITVIEPIREEKTHKLSPTPKPKSPAKKALRILGNGLGVLCYMLCICCVLSGPQQPQAKKTRQGYYYQHDDDFAELEGTRVRAVESNGSAASSIARRSKR